jgi:hypothetical protein
MQGYQSQVDELRDQLSKARSALARDIAAAVATKDWARDFLRDRHDVSALVEHIEEARRQSDFVNKLHAAGDRERQQLRQRGRPRKPAKGPTAAKSTTQVANNASRVAGPG